MDVTTSVGRVLNGRYQVADLLGSGGMAAVWRGRDLRLDRPVAIKELAGGWLDDPDALRLFDREARTAARLTHPNVVAIHDVGRHGHTPYLVMELVDGVTVSRLLADGPLPLATVMAIGAQVCDGLAAAHRAGVIHRDIKPANLMLTHSGVVKICDFGISRALSCAAETSLTGPGYALGTSRYMAPEQALGEHVDARADLYGLGCTLYAMLVGAPPFLGNVQEVLAQHMSRPVVRPSVYRTDLPTGLEALVLRLLAKNPGDRPATAEEAGACLVEVMKGPTRPAVAASARAMAAVPASAVSAPAGSPSSGAAAAAGHRQPPARAAWYWLAATAALLAVAIPVVATWPASPQPRARSSGAINLPPPALPSTSLIATAPGTPSPASAPAPPPAASPSPGATKASSPPPSSSQPPAPDPVATLRLAIGQQVDTGNLSPDKAGDLYAKVDAIAHAAYAGNPNDEAKNIKAMRDRLTALRTGGQLSAAGYDTLTEDLDAVAATLP
jgi:eukaryotic-like serine/threonine-protein kinase